MNNSQVKVEPMFRSPNPISYRRLWSQPTALQLLALFLIQIGIGAFLCVSPLVTTGAVVAMILLLPAIYSYPTLVYLMVLMSIPTHYAQVGTRGGIDIKYVHIFTAIGFVTWIVQCLRRRDIRIHVNWTDLSILLLVSWVLLSIFWAAIPERAVFVNAKIFSVLVTYFVMTFLVKDKIALDRVLVAWLLVCFIWSVVGIYALIFESVPAAEHLILPVGQVPKLGKTARVSAIFDNPNELAFFMSTAIVLVILNFRVASKRGMKILALMTLLMANIVLISTFSRKSWLGVVLSLGVLAVRDRRILGGMAVIGTLSVIAIAVTAGSSSFVEALQNRVATLFWDPQVAMAERAQAWIVAKGLFLKSPIVGNGAGAFYALSPGMGSSLPIPHSLYWLMLAEYGLVGFGFLLILFFGCAYQLFLIMAKASDPSVSYFALGLLAVLASVIFQAAFKTFAFTNYNFIAFFALISAFTRIYAPARAGGSL